MFGERQQFAPLSFSDVGKGDSMERLLPELVDDLVIATGEPEECRQVMKTELVAGTGYCSATTRDRRCRP